MEQVISAGATPLTISPSALRLTPALAPAAGAGPDRPPRPVTAAAAARARQAGGTQAEGRHDPDGLSVEGNAHQEGGCGQAACHQQEEPEEGPHAREARCEQREQQHCGEQQDASMGHEDQQEEPKEEPKSMWYQSRT